MTALARRFVRRVAALVAVCAVMAVLAPARSAGEPYEIPVVLPLTGTVAFLGNSVAKSLALLATEVNASGGIAGRPIAFAINDDQSNPAVDVQIVNRIVASKAPVMIGPELTASCAAAVPLLKDGPVSMCLSPGLHPDPGGYAFSAAASNLDLAIVTQHYAKRRGWKRVAFLFTTDASGQDGEHWIRQAFGEPEASGTQIVAIEHYGVTDVSVAAQLARIKAAAPDALDVWSSGASSATALRGIQDAGLDIPILTSYSNATSAQMAAYKGFVPKELLIAGPPAMLPPDQLDRGRLRNAVDAFYAAFERAGTRPDVLQAGAWDAGHIVVAALRSLGPNATAAQVRAYIAGLSNFSGVTGSFDFRAIPQRGQDWRSSVLMTRWDPAKGTFVRASPIGG